LVQGATGGTYNLLYEVAVVAANDVWAVGSYYEAGGPRYALIEHWDGSSWSVVPTPTIGTGSELYAVAAVSANNVWDVGVYYSTGAPGRTLVEHWYGSSWSVVPSPSPGTDNSVLRGIAVVSANDIWAVGYSLSNTRPHLTLIEYWDGARWFVVPSPNPGTDNRDLNGVAAVSTNDVWAVGSYYLGGAAQTLV